MNPPKIFIATDGLSFLAPESIARLAASYFEGKEHLIEKIPNVKTAKKAGDIVNLALEYGSSMIVFSTLINEVKELFIQKCENYNIPYLDILSSAVNNMSKLFNTTPVSISSQLLQLTDEYYRRIQAIEFAINNDDGKSLDSLNKADVVLIGVSRTSKTPLSIYLAYMNLLVVNIPLIFGSVVPRHIYNIPKSKVIGLTISVEKLNKIRTDRNTAMGLKGDNSYSDTLRIIEELEFADGIMKKITVRSKLNEGTTFSFSLSVKRSFEQIGTVRSNYRLSL